MTNKGKVWSCKDWPHTWLCHEAGYEPGEDWHGSPIYLQAWQEVLPTNAPSISVAPSSSPSYKPSLSIAPSNVPSKAPSNVPSESPVARPSLSPSASVKPSLSPSDQPSVSVFPSTSIMPSKPPSNAPSTAPSASQKPSTSPVFMPSGNPSDMPSLSIAPSTSSAPSVSNAPSYSWCQQPKSVCIALDGSSSVWFDGWDLEVAFATDLVTALQGENGIEFSVVQFHDTATIESNLASATDTLSTLSNLTYARETTNTAEGINKCQETLDLSDPGRQNIMAFISDGMPYVPGQLGSQSEAQARDAAAIAKNKGTHIVTLFINDNYYPSALDLMKDISSVGEVTYSQGFNALDGLVETFASEVVPC